MDDGTKYNIYYISPIINSSKATGYILFTDEKMYFRFIANDTTSVQSINNIPVNKKYVDDTISTASSSLSPKFSLLSYGHSTWNDFITAYQNNSVVYCRASSSSNPATGSQTRLAFMAYVNNADNPTNVEFQYYRSVNSHTESQQGDQVFVYKLDKTSGWTVTTREASSKVVVGNGLSSSYSSDTVTLSADTNVLATKSYVDSAIGSALGGSY